MSEVSLAVEVREGGRLMRTRAWAPFVALTLMMCLPAYAGVVKSKRALLKERYQGKNILFSSNEQYESFYSNRHGRDAELQLDAAQNAQVMNQPMSGALEKTLPQQKEDTGDYRMLPAKPTPVEYAIYQTGYSVEIEEEIAFVREEVQLEVFKKDGPTGIPLVNADVGLKEVSLDRKPSIVSREGNKYFVLINKTGRRSLDIEFFVKVSREREHGPGRFSFEAFPSPISLLDVQISEPDMDIFVEPSIKIEKETAGTKTLATVVLPYTEQVSIRWNPAVGKVELPSVKLEPKLYADVA